jgi:hypothetical protein
VPPDLSVRWADISTILDPLSCRNGQCVTALPSGNCGALDFFSISA